MQPKLFNAQKNQRRDKAHGAPKHEDHKRELRNDASVRAPGPTRRERLRAHSVSSIFVLPASANGNWPKTITADGHDPERSHSISSGWRHIKRRTVLEKEIIFVEKMKHRIVNSFGTLVCKLDAGTAAPCRVWTHP